jgi:putative acetyltransferase
MEIETLNPKDEAVLALIEVSNRYYTDLYPPGSTHLTSHDELGHAQMIFIGGRVDGKLVASGAARIMNDDGNYAEIKRVYVLDGHRGLGLSKAIMNLLELEIANRGITLLRLETGIKQPEAIGLYRKLGYLERSPFGAYQLDPLSVFMEKDMLGNARFGDTRFGNTGELT